MNGWKTYLAAALGFIATGALAMGYLTQDQYNVIIGILGSLGLAALRAGVTKNGPNG